MTERAEVTIGVDVDEWDGDLADDIASAVGPVLLTVGGHVFDVNVEHAHAVTPCPRPRTRPMVRVPAGRTCSACGMDPAYVPPDFPCDHRVVSDVQTYTEDDTGFVRFRCPICRGESFRYDESHPSSRTQDEERTSTIDTTGKPVLAFNSHFEWYDGDDDPGIVCDGCEAHLTYDESMMSVDFTP